MTDFGTPEERAVALHVALACKELNKAISCATAIGVNCRIVELNGSFEDPSELMVERMERRQMILPAALDGVTV